MHTRTRARTPHFCLLCRESACASPSQHPHLSVSFNSCPRSQRLRCGSTDTWLGNVKGYIKAPGSIRQVANKFQDPVPAPDPSCNAAACLPEQPGWRQLRCAGCRGCWRDGSGPPQPQLQKPDTIPPSPAQKSKEEMATFCGL